MGFGFPFFTCKNQNCTKNQSVWLFRLYFGVFSCHRFYITFKSTALWKLSDIKILPNYSFSREIRGLSDMNFITAWNLTGIIETWYKWLNWLNYFYFFIFMRRESGGRGGGGLHIVLIDCMLFQPSFLDVVRMSTVSFFEQLNSN